MTEPLMLHLPPMRYKVARAFLHDGAKNDVLARRVFVVESTLQQHFTAIMAAAGVKGRPELAVRFWRGEFDFYNDEGQSLRDELERIPRG